MQDALFLASKLFWLFARPNTFALFLAVLAGQMVILAYTHRAGLRRRPHWRLGRGRPSAG